MALDLLRTYGFEGVSQRQLADAIALEKESLYYGFPGGKDASAIAIARDIVTRFQANVFEPLVGTGLARKRVSFVAGSCGSSILGGRGPA